MSIDRFATFDLPQSTQGAKYTIDVALAFSSDDSADFIILENEIEQGRMTLPNLDPHNAAIIAMALGRFYNDALLKVETNGFGFVTAKIIERLGYPHTKMFPVTKLAALYDKEHK
jgi:hypothetical protein